MKEEQDVEVERRVNELMTHCPNHKYGCKFIGSLLEIPDHLADCGETRDANLPAYYDETNSKVDILKKLADVSQQLNRFSEQTQQATDDSNQQIQQKFDHIEQMMTNKFAKAEEQQNQMKVSLMGKLEELDQRRLADFMLKLDQIGQKIDTLKTRVDENRNLIDEIKTEYQLSTNEIRKTAKAWTTNSRRHEYNILLLGPRWSGKSTFINSLANYLKYDTIEEAMNGQMQCLIPGRITFKGPNNEEKTISFGAQNELNPHSKLCQCYQLKFNDDVIRLIDSPGIDDEPREQQLRNWQNVIETMINHQQLHAIAIVMKPYETALIHDLINECINFVLSHLEQTAVDNLIFVVTCSNEDPTMDTETIIKKCITEIMLKSKMSINMDENRFYRLDNCGFHYLIMKRSGKIISEENEDVWSQSVNECRRLIQYITKGPDGKGLKPHLTNNTVNLNEAKNLANIIGHLPQQIDQKLGKDEKYLEILTKNKEEISNFIKDHKELVEKHANQINDSTKDTFICKSDSCRLEIVINSSIKKHHPHSCTNLTYGLFTHGSCADCHCSVDKHEKVDSKTRAVQLKAFITDVEATVEKAQLDEYSMECTIARVQNEQKQLITEKEIISSAVLNLNKYHQNHALLQPTDQDTQTTENITNQYDNDDQHTVSNIKQQLFQLHIYGTEIRNAYV